MVSFPTPHVGLVVLTAALLGSGNPALAWDQPPVAAAPVPPAASPSAAESSTEAGTPSPPQVPAKLSLKQCLELALAHNPDYKQSLVSVANAQSKLRSTTQLHHLAFDTDLQFGHSTDKGSSVVSTFGPSLSLSDPNGAGLTSNATIPGVDSPSLGGQAGLEYTLPLLRGRGRGSEVRAQIAQATIDTNQARLEQFENEQNLIDSVTQAYYNVLRAQELLKIQQQAVAIAQESTTASQKRLDAGLITELDVTRAKLQLSNTQAQLIQQQESYQNAVDALVLILGLPVGAQPELTDTVNYAYSPTDQATSIQTALARRPELNLNRLEQQNADVQLALAQTQRKPQADVKFNLAAVGFSLLGGGGLANVLTSLLGLHVNVPMKERSLQENVAQAERNRDILDDMYEFQRQKIVGEVRSLVRQAEASKANVDLQTTSLDVAKKSVHIAQRMVDEGLRDNFYLLDAQTQQTNAESSLLSAKVDYLLTMINLRRAMGLSLREYFGLPEAADDGYFPRAGGQLLLTHRRTQPRQEISEAERPGPGGSREGRQR